METLVATFWASLEKMGDFLFRHLVTLDPSTTSVLFHNSIWFVWSDFIICLSNLSLNRETEKWKWTKFGWGWPNSFFVSKNCGTLFQNQALKIERELLLLLVVVPASASTHPSIHTFATSAPMLLLLRLLPNSDSVRRFFWVSEFFRFCSPPRWVSVQKSK